jgi:hypothetical protein
MYFQPPTDVAAKRAYSPHYKKARQTGYRAFLKLLQLPFVFHQNPNPMAKPLTSSGKEDTIVAIPVVVLMLHR